MGVDQVAVVQVGCLVFPGLVFHAQLGHPVVLADRETAAPDIDCLAQFVVTVQGGQADLDADDARLVLDVQFAVDIAGMVVGDDLALDHHVVVLDLEDAVLGIEGLEFGNRGGRRQFGRLIHVHIPVLQGEHRLPLLAGSEGERGGKDH